MKKDVSIIIVNYNTKDFVTKCLESLDKYTENVSTEIIVVENLSTDDSFEYLDSLNKKRKEKFKLIRASQNKGFAAGNNIGIREATGRYVLLLNPDCEIIEDNTITKVVEYMDSNQKIGITGCKLLNSDKSTQGSGGYFPTLPKVFSWMLFLDNLPLANSVLKPYHPKIDSYYDKDHSQDWVTGAFFMIRREVINKVGTMDEDYFVYVEELDYCYQAVGAGWKVQYLRAPSVIHHGQAASGSEFATLSEFKGLKIFYKKHQATWQLTVLRAILKLGALVRVPIFFVTKGHMAAKTYVKAFIQA